MPAGGIWWVNTERQEDLFTFVNETLAAQAQNSHVAVLMSDGIIRNHLAFTTSGPETVQLFSLKPTKSSLESLQSDLLCSRSPENYLFILACHETLWDVYSAPQLRRWLQKLNRWAQHYRCSFLIVNNGRATDRFTSLLINEYRGLDGLATLQFLGEKFRLDVEFWCNDSGVSAQQHIMLDYKNGSWSQMNESTSAPQPLNDTRQILSHIGVLEGAPALSEHWKLFENNDALFNAARTSQAATIVFQLSQNSQIEQMATMIHTLRRQRGSALKLVVREKNACLRATDERLLLGCGTSLIVPWNSSLSRCLSLIESIQEQKFTRHVPEDIQVLLQAMHPLKQRGYLKWEEFCQSLDNILTNPLIPEDNRGLLVALRPVPGLKVEQLLTLCRPNRLGDIVTLGDNRLYLFLSFCRINDLDVALKHIFPLPIGDLISNRVVWFEDKQIAAELTQMRISDPAQRSRPLPDLTVQQPAVNASHDGKVWRRNPQPVVLLRDNLSQEEI
ncbi:protein BcsE [Salmonella enterica subsp. enterica serovar Choleraesuis]|nr:protein BcsE [Salmonella enterica subsp. enterica serovar Choleraesuis]